MTTVDVDDDVDDDDDDDDDDDIRKKVEPSRRVLNLMWSIDGLTEHFHLFFVQS